jgi:hypothetical protein
VVNPKEEYRTSQEQGYGFPNIDFPENWKAGRSSFGFASEWIGRLGNAVPGVIECCFRIASNRYAIKATFASVPRTVLHPQPISFRVCRCCRPFTQRG